MDNASLKITEDDILVRIYVSENEKLHGKSLYEVIVQKAREVGLAGATVFKGILGFGADHRMHTAKLLDLSDNLPIMIEMVDLEENILRLMPFLDENVKSGFVTMEKVHVIKYRHNKQ